MPIPEVVHKTSDVFGINRDLPLNYTTRKDVDDSLVENLTRDKHIVIYGSSKQGKTSLRKHCLQEDDYIIVHCFNRWSLGDLHAAILKRAGYEITQSSTKTTSGRNKIFASLKAAIFGNEASAGLETERQKTDSVTKAPLELDPDDVNDIITALIHLDRYIVLEDFHYLSVETQKDFSVALKAFHEESNLCFIVVGVWLEENRLTVYNGDLTGRVVSVNADKWSHKELDEVIKVGESLLNIQFAPEFRDTLISQCFESVYILQEACYQCCIQSSVNLTQVENIVVGADEKTLPT